MLINFHLKHALEFYKLIHLCLKKFCAHPIHFLFFPRFFRLNLVTFLHDLFEHYFTIFEISSDCFLKKWHGHFLIIFEYNKNNPSFEGKYKEKSFRLGQEKLYLNNCIEWIRLRNGFELLMKLWVKLIEGQDWAVSGRNSLIAAPTNSC